MTTRRNLFGFDADNADEPIIKAFHSWDVQWDSGGINSVIKAARAALNPTTPVKKSDKRIITAEIHRIPPAVKGGMEAEKCVIRVMIPTEPADNANPIKGATSALREIMPKRAIWSKRDANDADSSVATLDEENSVTQYRTKSIGMGGMVAGRVEGYPLTVSDGGGSNYIPLAATAKTKYHLSLTKLHVLHHKGPKVSLSVGIGRTIKTLTFQSGAEADGFVQLISHLRAGRAQREERRKLAALNSIILQNENATLNFLVEIVSCWKLPDLRPTDPFVKVTLDHRDCHRTKHISQTTEPIYTIRNGSLFVLSTTMKKLFESREGLRFTVLDYNSFASDVAIGGAIVPPRALYDSKGERMIFELAPPPGEPCAKGGNGFIAIRCRHATENDLDFMAKLRHGIENVGEKSPIALSNEGGKSAIKSLVTSKTKTETRVDRARDVTAKVKKYRVRPGPDPSRKAETRWMTQAEIQEEAMKRSTNWFDAGSGDLGRVYLEIIGCDGLPNLDFGGNVGNVKTDAFVCVVYEDCVLKTDVVADKLSPRWMPWSKRAFQFRMMHSSSQLLLGIFDYNAMHDHSIIGRVKLDVSSYSANTEFLVHLNIYNSDQISHRKPRGTITVRLMFEYENERGLILSALPLPRSKRRAFYVNMQDKKDFNVVRYTATGKQGAEEYGLKAVNEYLDELLMCKRLLFYIHEAFLQIIFWRGHAPVTLCVPRLRPWKDIQELGGKRCSRSVTVKLPLRSLVVFIAAVHLVNHPNDLPAFVFGTFAFVMLASLHFRRQSPSKWTRCKTFRHYLGVLLLGNHATQHTPLTIAPYENAKEFETYQKNIENRAAQFEQDAETAREKNLRKQEEYQKELEQFGDGSLDLSSSETRRLTFSFDPFKALWVQIQTLLEQVVMIERFSHNVFIWEEAFLAFWLTLSACMLSFVCFFIRWGSLIEWTMRILVWLFLGPWMKLADIFWDSHVKLWIQKIREFQEKQEMEAMDLMKMDKRTAQENAEKMKDMKKALFGAYISRVPVYKCSRYEDVPLLSSEANPCPASKLKEEKKAWNITRVPGQHLSGEMIPLIEDPVCGGESLSPTSVEFDNTDVEEADSPAEENDPLLGREQSHWYDGKLDAQIAGKEDQY